MLKRKMKAICLILFCASFFQSFGQRSADSATLHQSVKLTNIDTSDIVEINSARQMLITHFIKKANTKGSLLYNLIKKEYVDYLEDGKNGFKIETRYPEKISANNILISFIDKALENYHNLNDYGELRMYNFLVTIPIYNVHHGGHDIDSFSILEHFVVSTTWTADTTSKEVSPKKTISIFYNPQKVNIHYSNLHGNGDLEQ